MYQNRFKSKLANRRWWYFLFAGMFLALCMFVGQIHASGNSTVPPLQGKDTDSECVGLDVVFLIDQSSTMIGMGMPPNDPEGFRIATAQWVIDRLGDNRIFFCNEAVHRIAVIGFGDREEIAPEEDFVTYVDPTSIRPDPLSTLDAWREASGHLKQRIISESLGATDFRAAFLAAKSIFDYWDRPDQDELDAVGSLPRRRAIILTTDGRPCVIDMGCRVHGSTWSSSVEKSYMAELYAWIQGNFLAEGENSVSVSLVLMNDAYSVESDTLEVWQTIIQQYHGSIERLSRNREDIATATVRILDRLIWPPFSCDPDSQICWRCGESSYMEAYVDVATISFLKSREELSVSLEKVGDEAPIVLAQGKVVRGASDSVNIQSYETQGAIEVYRLRKPQPGLWKVSAENCREVQVITQFAFQKVKQVAPLGELAQVDSDPYYDVQNPTHLEFAVQEVGSGGEIEIFEEIPGFSLSWRLTIKDEKGNVLIDNEDAFNYVGESLFRSKEPLLLQNSGHYFVEVQGMTKAVNPLLGPTREVFKAKGSYTVRQVSRFGFQINTPLSGQVLPLNGVVGTRSQLVPVHVEGQLLDSSDAPVMADTIVHNLGKPVLVARIYGPDGEPLEEKSLEYNRQRNVFEVDLRTTDELGSTLDDPGSYTIKLELLENYDSIRYRPRYSIREVSFERYIIAPLDYKVHTAAGLGEEVRQPLYEGRYNTCIGAQVVPIEFSLFLVDPARPDGPLDPAPLVQGNPSALFSAVLLDPENVEHPVTLTMQTGREGPMLTGTTGTEVPLAGEYVLRIVPRPEALMDRYQFINTEPTTIQVFRKGDLLSRPSTCRTAAGGASGLVALLLLVLIWHIATRPVGIITFGHRKTGLVMHEEFLGRPLRGWRHTYQSKHPGLEELGVSRLKATRARRPEEAIRAINLTLYDEGGAPFLQEDGLPNGGDFDLDAEIVVRYE